jgi:phage shock protein C
MWKLSGNMRCSSYSLGPVSTVFSSGIYGFFAVAMELWVYNYVLFIGRPGGGIGMYCNYCGKVIQDDAAVCAYCGVRVGASVARKRLVRPRQGRKIAGVCLGFAEYFDIDVTAIRLVWLITSFMTGIGLISYPIAWIVMPEEPLLVTVPVGAQRVTNL